MNKKPIQLESYYQHTGLTEAEATLLIDDDISEFVLSCIRQLVSKGIVEKKAETLTILEPFSTILKNENNESVLLIHFAKQEVVLFAYEIPLLKLMLTPIQFKLLVKKVEIIQKVFYDWLEYRLIGFDAIATKEYYQNLLGNQ